MRLAKFNNLIKLFKYELYVKYLNSSVKMCNKRSGNTKYTLLSDM